MTGGFPWRVVYGRRHRSRIGIFITCRVAIKIELQIQLVDAKDGKSELRVRFDSPHHILDWQIHSICADATRQSFVAINKSNYRALSPIRFICLRWMQCIFRLIECDSRSFPHNHEDWLSKCLCFFGEHWYCSCLFSRNDEKKTKLKLLFASALRRSVFADKSRISVHIRTATINHECGEISCRILPRGCDAILRAVNKLFRLDAEWNGEGTGGGGEMKCRIIMFLASSSLSSFYSFIRKWIWTRVLGVSESMFIRSSITLKWFRSHVLLL